MPSPLSPSRSWVEDGNEDDAGSRWRCCRYLPHLSWWSWSFIVLLKVIAATILFHSPADAVLLPGFFLAPLLVLYLCYWRPLRREIPLDLVIKAFAFGFAPGVVLVMMAETALAGVFFLLCFHEQIPGWYKAVSSRVPHAKAPHRGRGLGGGLLDGLGAGGMLGPVINVNEDTLSTPRGGATEDEDPLKELEDAYGLTVARTPGFYLFLLLLSYLVAAGVEESLKYCAPQRLRACRNSPSPYVYLVAALACALGFATAENIGYTFGSAGDANTSDLAARAGTAYSRAVVAIAAHGICGALVGLGLTRRHVLGERRSYLQVLLPSVAVHGTFDAQQMLIIFLITGETAQTATVLVLNTLVLVLAAIFLHHSLKGLRLDRFRSEPVARSLDEAEGGVEMQEGSDSPHCGPDDSEYMYEDGQALLRHAQGT